MDCRSLRSLTIPGNVKSIVQWYSRYPYGLDDLYYFTFGNCENLKEFVIEYSPDELIGKCDKSSYEYYVTCDLDFLYLRLEKLSIDRVLNNDVKLPLLKELVVGEHIEIIQIIPDWSLDLEKITIHAINPPVSKEFTTEQYNTIELYVPLESYELYRQAEVWKNFKHIHGFDSAGVEEVHINNIEKVEIGRFNLNGQNVTDDYDGIVVIRYSDGSTQKVISHKNN